MLTDLSSLTMVELRTRFVAAVDVTIDRTSWHCLLELTSRRRQTPFSHCTLSCCDFFSCGNCGCSGNWCRRVSVWCFVSKDSVPSRVGDLGGDGSVAVAAWSERPARCFVRGGPFQTDGCVLRAATLVVSTLVVWSSTGSSAVLSRSCSVKEVVGVGVGVMTSQSVVSLAEMKSSRWLCSLSVCVADTMSLSSLVVGLLVSSLLSSVVRGLYANQCNTPTHFTPL